MPRFRLVLLCCVGSALSALSMKKKHNETSAPTPAPSPPAISGNFSSTLPITVIVTLPDKDGRPQQVPIGDTSYCGSDSDPSALLCDVPFRLGLSRLTPLPCWGRRLAVPCPWWTRQYYALRPNRTLSELVGREWELGLPVSARPKTEVQGNQPPPILHTCAFAHTFSRARLPTGRQSVKPARPLLSAHARSRITSLRAPTAKRSTSRPRSTPSSRNGAARSRTSKWMCGTCPPC